MAVYEYNSLKNEYKDFINPIAIVRVDDKRILDNKHNFIVSDIYVDITSEFEASIANFSIYNCFDKVTNTFLTKELKPYITLGSKVSIFMGYATLVKQVFVGFISDVEFMYNPDGLSGVKVNCMDAKGIMMMNGYCRQLASTNYSDAINEILEKNAYTRLQSTGIINDINITATPDKKQSNANNTIKTIDMVSESDYEFIVRAAKRFNYEFFLDNGSLFFRKAKSNDNLLMELSSYSAIENMNIQYDFTGILGMVIVRGTDLDRAKLVEAKIKNNNKVSMGNKAKGYIKGNQKTYVDATIHSQADADNRASYLMEDSSYHFGSMEMSIIGLPEIKPGFFIETTQFGESVSNKFYIIHAIHTFDSESGYHTKILAKANQLK